MLLSLQCSNNKFIFVGQGQNSSTTEQYPHSTLVKNQEPVGMVDIIKN